MSDRSSWLQQQHPLIVATVIVFGGSIALGALSLLLVPLFILAEANALLGFFGLLVLAVFGYAGLTMVLDSEAEETADSEVGEIDPVTELEQRYVRGELSDAAFERRLERIIETDAELKRTPTRNETDRTAQKHPNESHRSQKYDTERV